MKIAIIAMRDDQELPELGACLFVAVHQTELQPTPDRVLSVCQTLGNQCGRYLARATERRGDTGLCVQLGLLLPENER